MAKLTADGIEFAASPLDELNSKRGIFPQSTVWNFFQASAPTGWTQNTTTTVNNKALRVVNGTGGGTGGTQNFTTIHSTLPISGQLTTPGVQVGPTALTTAQIAAHTHPQSTRSYNAVPALFNPAGQFTGWNGGQVVRNPGRAIQAVTNTGPQGQDTAHTHPLSLTGPISQSLDMAVQYIDIIYCSFNG